jgi:AcrR family transcriptional regulator
MNAEISERQKEIITVSLELIAKKGIQGLTIKNLAKKIGFTEAAVYRHYENKIQILIAILDYFREDTNRFFVNEMKSEENATQKIEHLFLNHFKTFSETPSLVSVVFAEEIFRNEAVLIEKVAEIMKKNTQILLSIIESGQKKSEIRSDINSHNLAVIIMGSLRMFVKQWQMSDYSFSLTERGTEYIKSVIKLIKN